MENLKIKVNSEDESKEVQELFFELGYRDRKNWTQKNPTHESIQAWKDGEFTFSLNHNQVPVGFEEITLQELRDMVVFKRESLNDKIATAEVARQQSKNIDATLAERQSQYGSFTSVANTTGQLMAVIKNSPNGHTMPYAHEEALHMICSKIARIMNGDFNHLDSWHDIGGYSKLIEDLIGDNNEI